MPRLAPAPQAEAILERLQKLSKPFGTNVEIENEVGVIRVRANSARPVCTDTAPPHLMRGVDDGMGAAVE